MANNHERSRAFTQGQEVVNNPETENEEFRRFTKDVFDLFAETTLNPESGEDAKKPYLIFDLDGTLIEVGLETALDTTLEQYVASHAAEVAAFKAHIADLQARGFGIVVNTGRGDVFTSRVIQAFFPEESIDWMITDHGGLITDKEGNERFVGAMQPDSKAGMLQIKDSLEVAFAAQGWGVEQKKANITLNPPQIEGRVPQDFIPELKTWMQDQGVDPTVFDIVASPTAIDVFAKGTTKRAALEEALGSEPVAIYFGDSSGDYKAMEGSPVVIVPENAGDSTKKYTQGLTEDNEHRTRHTFHVQGVEVEGVNAALSGLGQVVDLFTTQKM